MPVFGQDDNATNVQSPGARAAQRSFNGDLERLNEFYRTARLRMAEKYSEEFRKLRARVVEDLQKAQKDATTAGNLDEALAIRNAVEHHRSMPDQPPDLKVLPGTEGDDKKVQELEREITRLKRQVTRVTAVLEMERRLINTRWVWLAESNEIIEFREDGVMIASWSANPAVWQVNPDLSVTWYYPATKGSLSYMTFDTDLTKHSSYVLKRDMTRSGVRIK
jgi:hypothetical protein